jgi:surfactin synthase thioesterase subunit
MTRVLFLPGAGASPDFWKPVGTRLPPEWTKEYFAWPGLGDQPHDPSITGIDDLVQLVLSRMDEPVDLAAQSMGGVIAPRSRATRPSAALGAHGHIGWRRHGGPWRRRLAR